jgi:uncharacterized PurR-regulated membrane protein YhhQ (DUF165 family)
MLRFVLDVLLLRKLFASRTARAAMLVGLLAALIAGLIYALVFLQAAEKRSHVPHVYAYSTR